MPGEEGLVPTYHKDFIHWENEINKDNMVSFLEGSIYSI